MDEEGLRWLIKMENHQGARLRLRFHKKYPYILTGKDRLGRTIKAGGDIKFLTETLLSSTNIRTASVR